MDTATATTSASSFRALADRVPLRVALGIDVHRRSIREIHRCVQRLHRWRTNGRKGVASWSPPQTPSLADTNGMDVFRGSSRFRASRSGTASNRDLATFVRPGKRIFRRTGTTHERPRMPKQRDDGTTSCAGRSSLHCAGRAQGTRLSGPENASMRSGTVVAETFTSARNSGRLAAR